MTVLVTGGAGFIGSHVAAAYLERGADVAVVDDLSVGRRDWVPDGAAFHKVNIRDAEAVADVLADVQPTVVNHHAAHNDAMDSLERPQHDAETNVVGSINVLEAARQHGVEHVVYASSGGLSYGEPESVPTPEDHPMRPSYPYGTSKYAVEHYLALYDDLYGLPYTVLRYASVYGPRATGGVIKNFLEAVRDGERPVIFGDGSQTRDFIHVDDVVAANMAAADGRGCFNVGTCTETSISSLWETVADVTGSNAAPQHEDRWLGDIDRCKLDCSKAAAELGWTADIKLRDGLERTWRWVR